MTGVERLGLLYSHGEQGQEGWNFIAAVGDEASDHHLAVDKSGQLIAAWIEGRAKTLKSAPPLLTKVGALRTRHACRLRAPFA